MNHSGNSLRHYLDYANEVLGIQGLFSVPDGGSLRLVQQGSLSVVFLWAQRSPLLELPEMLPKIVEALGLDPTQVGLVRWSPEDQGENAETQKLESMPKLWTLGISFGFWPSKKKPFGESISIYECVAHTRWLVTYDLAVLASDPMKKRLAWKELKEFGKEISVGVGEAQ